MKFIGRQTELAKLNSEYRRDGSFTVIYGRRRIGKTTLIKEFLRGKTAFYFLATEEMESQSIKRLAGVVARTTKNSLLQKAEFTDWMDLFQIIADYKPEEKKVLVIDEFPYLVKINPAFPSVLQNAWDEILKDNNVMMILSGSLIGMMQKHALSYDSPLYGRRTAQMRLAPLSFTEIYAVQSLSFDNAVEQYAVTGGVPKYLEFFNDNRGLIEQLKDNVLSKSGFLYEEPNFLLKSESITAVNYFSIIKTKHLRYPHICLRLRIWGLLKRERRSPKRIRKSPVRDCILFRIIISVFGFTMFILIRENWNWITFRSFWMKSVRTL